MTRTHSDRPSVCWAIPFLEERWSGRLKLLSEEICYTQKVLPKINAEWHRYPKWYIISINLFLGWLRLHLTTAINSKVIVFLVFRRDCNRRQRLCWIRKCSLSLHQAYSCRVYIISNTKFHFMVENAQKDRNRIQSKNMTPIVHYKPIRSHFRIYKMDWILDCIFERALSLVLHAREPGWNLWISGNRCPDAGLRGYIPLERKLGDLIWYIEPPHTNKKKHPLTTLTAKKSPRVSWTHVREGLPVPC